jgi:hypothetical protein
LIQIRCAGPKHLASNEICWTTASLRQITQPKNCPTDYILKNSKCSGICNDGDVDVAGVYCTQDKCPSSFTDTGKGLCAGPAHTFPQIVDGKYVCPPEAPNVNYWDLCSYNCPARMTDIGMGCTKYIYPKTTSEPTCDDGFDEFEGNCNKTCEKPYTAYGNNVCVKDCPEDYIQCGIACVKDTNLCSEEIMTYLTIRLGLLETISSSKEFKGDFSQIVSAGDKVPTDVKMCP